MPARPESNVLLVGVVALLVAVGAMAIDHLVGTDRTDDEGLVDPAMFAISVGFSLAVAVFSSAGSYPARRAEGPSARRGAASSAA